MANLKSFAQTLGGNDGRLGQRPPLIGTEKNSSSLLLIDSSDRLSGATPFNFTVDLQSNVPRVRYIKLRNVILPQVNNVHAGNNTFRIKSALGTTGVITLTPGFYNTTTLSNEITSKINARFVTDAIADTVTTTFNPQQRNFSITSVGGNNMFIIGDDDTLLIKYGENLIPFESEPEANVPGTAVIYSGISPLLPARYFIITSNSLTQNQYGRSIISSTVRQLNNIIGVIDLTNLYTPEDYDISVPFTGVYKKVDIDGDHIAVMNSQDTLNRNIDIQIIDGYGRNVDTFYQLAAPNPVNSKLSVVLNIEVSY